MMMYSINGIKRAGSDFAGGIIDATEYTFRIRSYVENYAENKDIELPKLGEIFEKAEHHTNVVCSLQNFEDEDSILLYQGKYVDGYIRAIKDFVDKDYNPDFVKKEK